MTIDPALKSQPDLLGQPLRDHFLLDPEIVFLNHGSFGACPRQVFEAYQSWQRELERQPVEFLGRRAVSLMAQARAALAEYLGAGADEVVFFPNPTTAINMVARSLEKMIESFSGKPVQPGDQILTTDHEYGALVRTWKFTCQRLGMQYVELPIPLPVTTHEEFVERFWEGVTDRTRLVYLSHITSPTALIFPVEEICRRARQAGILCVVDGAHAAGQIPLNLNEIGADIYTGANHKWLCAPKGSAFLYVRRELAEALDPLVVSWGYHAEEGFGSGVQFIDYHEWQGTRDLSAFLAVPAAIEFQREQHWESVRERCRHLVVDTRRRVNALTGLPPICPEGSKWLGQMFSAWLPARTGSQALSERLYKDFRIEVPIIKWNDQSLIRVSFQGYNRQQDADVLISALESCLP
jgi:isopenicillin-N epimerase